MKKLLLGFAVWAVTGSAAPASEEFVIKQPCSEPLACIEITGPHSIGEVTLHDGTRYKHIAAESTCCQLAGGIQHLVCEDGYNSMNLKVTCN